ncbi:Xanthine/uracil/thiamine/ascorbate permease family protein [Mariniradius saccharolyticus AK6]|uniref:Xanthine/uracil/thiamine/ascorbate permease family protein n=1 Tax=Mariniradius saccharolyticus AK6 TaxID=1239962 RepID=M7XE12_9BACT|nr:NCS2 family permease [Mariniradius saccharolyticus]EMS33124.1 Xanthine/uracil/thiamine/ascorbate permease family protein [Mariniradius saccharolyticus AK6]
MGSIKPTNTKTEILAGLSTFLACFYIIIVNPAILADAGMPFSGVVTATVLVSAFGSIMMGIYAKNPIVVAPGMGINAFFAYTAVKGYGLSYEEALGAVFWSGVIFLLLSIFKTREKIIAAIPVSLRHAVSAGIGLFICFIGFQNAHFIVDNPASLVGMASFKDPVSLTFLLGLMVTAALIIRKVSGAIILGILVTTLLAWPIGRWWGDASAFNFGTATVVNYSGFFATPDFSLLLKADILGSLRYGFLPVIFVFTFTILFDGISTFVGLAEASGLKDPDGIPRNMRQSLLTDAFATLFAGLVGSSSGTAYIESAVGIEEGGRTGKTAITAGLLFLPFMFFSPLLSIVPAVASSIALVLVGSFMVIPLTKIEWKIPQEAIPAFLTMVLIPFTYSLSTGISFGFISWTVLNLLTGGQREVNPILAVISVLALFFLWQ